MTEAKTNKETKIHTPMAHIDPFPLRISYKGVVVASQTSIQIPKFQGSAISTTDDILSFYTKIIKERVPSFLTNIQFAGSNVIDSSASTVATVASGVGRSALAGGAMVSMAGIAVVDGVRAGIKSGKKARNADTNDGYKFGALIKI